MKQKRRRIRWMLESLLKKKGVNATKLAQDLQAMGCKLSISQAGRLAYSEPQKISVDPLIAMVKYFDCDIGDLLKVTGNNQISQQTLEICHDYILVLEGKEHHLLWKARGQFDESGFSYEKLSEKLDSVGVAYDRTTLCRIINEVPKRIDLAFLEGAMTVFNCNLTDIVDVE